MIRTAATGLGLGLVIASATGCKWTDFDDLEQQSWVSATKKPNGDSTDYGVAVQRGLRTSASGGKLVVIGAGQAQYTELVYTTDGSADLAPTALKLNNQYSIQSLDPQPLLIADPATDEVSLVVRATDTAIAVLHGEGGLLAHQIFGPSSPTAAAYMLPPQRSNSTDAPTSAPLVASGDTVYGSFFGVMGIAVSPKCQLLDEANMPVEVRALAAAKVAQTTFDDVIVWGTTAANPTTGKLLIYSGSVFNGDPPFGDGTTCVPTATPISVPVTTPFAPSLGSSIVMLEGKYALLVGHKDAGNADSYLGLFDVSTTTPAEIGAANTLPGLRTAAILDLGAQKYAIAGYPNETFDGVKAGKVLAFPLDTTTGLGATPAMMLNDAQPEADQAFGRTIAVTEFNGKPVIAIGADNEVFLYFRTALYEETRQ